MTYEEYLDEVTTILTELYELDDAAAIKLVVDAQDAEFFVQHDDKPEMCTLEQAKKLIEAQFPDAFAKKTRPPTRKTSARRSV